MTTAVMVRAHCAKHLEVIVSITDRGNEVSTQTLQDGDEAIFHAYGERTIHVREWPKAEHHSASDATPGIGQH